MAGEAIGREEEEGQENHRKPKLLCCAKTAIVCSGLSAAFRMYCNFALGHCGIGRVSAKTTPCWVVNVHRWEFVSQQRGASS